VVSFTSAIRWHDYLAKAADNAGAMIGPALAGPA
jgi:hypothetical protein